ncbi:hypothetical protein AB0I69_30720 [Streptomyces sp. NPDC050508]|uniref:hypothetical protein n=1 Tax=Streptomyces sp. NPDC050508 TaxID=3155405 RepID=UPI0034276DF2
MADIDFYADTVLRHRVLDIPLGSPPSVWEERLGTDFLDDLKKGRMRRDYGLVELTFAKKGEKWESVTASLQIHRLEGGGEGLVPSQLEYSFGQFTQSVLFGAFIEALRSRGVDLEEVSGAPTKGFSQFRAQGSQTSVYVRTTEPGEKPEGGTLWSIVLPYSAP